MLQVYANAKFDFDLDCRSTICDAYPFEILVVRSLSNEEKTTSSAYPMKLRWYTRSRRSVALHSHFALILLR
jgi:hypothetical protein